MSRKVIIIIGVVAAVLLGLSAGVFYMWQNQVLPQSAISLFKDVPAPAKTDIILVFTPHPDDESIAVGGYLATAVHNGAAVWIALVTDGNHQNQEAERYDEFKKATAYLGVPEDHLFFLGYPDHELKKQDANQVRSRFEEIISTVQPNIIISSTPLDHHPDHATVGAIVSQIMQGKNITYYQFLVHHNLFPQPKGMNPELYLLPPAKMITLNSSWQKFVLSEEMQTQKHKAILSYKTQLDDKRDPFLPGLLLSMLRQNELFIVPNK